MPRLGEARAMGGRNAASNGLLEFLLVRSLGVQLKLRESTRYVSIYLARTLELTYSCRD